MNLTNGFTFTKKIPNKNKLQFRVHYKNNFKTIDQIAQEAENNILAIQNLPRSPTDFGLKEHYYFENFDDDNEENSSDKEEEELRYKRKEIDYSNLDQNKEVLQNSKSLPPAPFFERTTKKFEKLVEENFQQVMQQTEQAFDDCYTKFEKNVDTVIYGIIPNQSQIKIPNPNKFGEGQRPSTTNQSRHKYQKEGSDQSIKKVKKEYSYEEDNNSFNNKRPVTAISYNAKFGKQLARSLSPIKKENDDASNNEIKQKWAKFINNTDKNLEKYEKLYHQNTVFKKPPVPQQSTTSTLPTAAVTATGPFYQTQPSSVGNQNQGGFVRSLSSRSSLQTQYKVQTQNNLVELHKLSSLLKKEIDVGFEEVNLKIPFLSGKILENLISSYDFKYKDIIQDVYKAVQEYMYLLDQQFIKKFEKSLQIKLILLIQNIQHPNSTYLKIIGMLKIERSQNDQIKLFIQFIIKQMEEQKDIYIKKYVCYQMKRIRN